MTITTNEELDQVIFGLQNDIQALRILKKNMVGVYASCSTLEERLGTRVEALLAIKNKI